MEFGELKSVPARVKWSKEAHEFTPWLAQNISRLSNAIGLELEVENTEVAAGPYSADILAKDTATDQYVVIENQLEKTDHDHLGKALTYASVLDATCIIWVATEFTPEHTKALDWLNDHTTEDISFYGVQIELWKIDDSKPALRFNIIASQMKLSDKQPVQRETMNFQKRKDFNIIFGSASRQNLRKQKRYLHYNLQGLSTGIMLP